MSFDLVCTNCFKTFRTRQQMKTHTDFASCKKKKTVEELEKENESLEEAIVIPDDDAAEAENIQIKKVEEIKKASVDMLDQLAPILGGQKTVDLSDDNFTELKSKLSFDFGARNTPSRSPIGSAPQSTFKAPYPVSRGRKVKGAVGEGRPCYYCALEEPDLISLALHYVRKHFEEVRKRQRFMAPKAKYHTAEQLQDARNIYTPPRPTPTAARHQQGLAGADRALSMGRNTPHLTPSWMRKLEGAKAGAGRADYPQAMQRYQAQVAAANRRILPKLAQVQAAKQANKLGYNLQTCDVCRAPFKTFNAMYRHKVKMHPGSLTKQARTNIGQPLGPTSSTGEPACEVCDDEFSWPDAGHSCPRKSAKVASNQAKVASNQARVVPNQAKVLSNPARVVTNPSRVVTNPAKMATLAAGLMTTGPILIED